MDPSALLLCRAVALILDLALVSYAGSHADRFDLIHLNRPLQDIFINGKSFNLFDINFSLAGLACLNGFLNGRKVWVLSVSWDQASECQPHELKEKCLHILTKIDVFADVWGPIWTVKDGTEDSSNINQINLSTGVIVPQPKRKRAVHPEAIPCHWYSSAAFRVRNFFPSSLRRSSAQVMARDSLLLIGNTMRENYECDYALDDFQADYGDCFRPLEGRESHWTWDTRGVSTSLGVSRIATGSISFFGSQRRIPEVTQKQAIISKWKNSPERVNCAVLNKSLAIEISNCTGNARRLPLRKLLTLPIFTQLLDQQYPRWSTTNWGSEFAAALAHEVDGVIVDVWKVRKEYRKEMAELVCSVLEVLDDTGLDGNKFTAAFLNHHQEWLVDLDPRKNEWMNILGSSPDITAYSFINHICLECQTTDHSTATHHSSEAYTVLHTRISSQEILSDIHYVKLTLHEQTFKVLNRIPNGLLITPETRLVSRATFNRNVLNAWEIDQVPSTVFRAGRICQTYVRASSKSFGGMRRARNRNPIIFEAQESDVSRDVTMEDATLHVEETPAITSHLSTAAPTNVAHAVDSERTSSRLSARMVRDFPRRRRIFREQRHGNPSIRLSRVSAAFAAPSSNPPSASRAPTQSSAPSSACFNASPTNSLNTSSSTPLTTSSSASYDITSFTHAGTITAEASTQNDSGARSIIENPINYILEDGSDEDNSFGIQSALRGSLRNSEDVNQLTRDLFVESQNRRARQSGPST